MTRRRVLACGVALVCVLAGSALIVQRIHSRDQVELLVNANVNADAARSECVVLVHGLARTVSSFEPLAEALQAAGYATVNAGYPSTRFNVKALAKQVFPPALQACDRMSAETIHVVTHSLGGILLRQFLANRPVAKLGRVVMLAPPNQGSEVVDALVDVPGYAWLNGPAGLELGTATTALPNRLGELQVDLAIIAGSASINLILSQWLPNPDDGKVSVANTRLEGMCGFLVLDVSHPFIMKDPEVIREVRSWLADGRFLSSIAEYPDCDARSDSST